MLCNRLSQTHSQVTPPLGIFNKQIFFFLSTFLLWLNILHLLTGPVLQNNLLNEHVPSNHGRIACHAFRMPRVNHPSEQLLLQRFPAEDSGVTQYIPICSHTLSNAC